MLIGRCCAFAILAVMAGCGVAHGLDLPVATGGFQDWAQIVAKAVTYGGKDQEQSLQALQSFHTLVMTKFHKQADMWTDVTHGNFTLLAQKLLTPNIQINAPVFFENGAKLSKSSAKGIDFSLKGFKFEPCAFLVNPTGVAVGATGINIAPQGISVAPTGVNVNPFGLSISPSLIVIAPFDTTVAGQGLNIAPALIAIAPVKTVVNPVGPLNIGGSVVSKELPALP